MMETRGITASTTTVARIAEILATTVLLASIPIAVIGLLLPINEYSWMVDDGGAFPPDCDSLAGFFLVPSGIVFACELLGFGYLALRQRSPRRLASLALSILMTAAIGCRIPEYLRESARADATCSR